jgi:hypothetical protein
MLTIESKLFICSRLENPLETSFEGILTIIASGSSAKVAIMFLFTSGLGRLAGATNPERMIR